MEYKDIITRIVNNDLQDDILQLTDAMYSKVFLYNKDPKLICKFLLGDQQEKEAFRVNLYNEIYRDDNLTSTIYDYGLTQINDVTFTYSIQNFLEGDPISRYPDDNLTKQIVSGVYDFTRRLEDASDSYLEIGIPTAYNICLYFVENAPECKMKDILKNKLSDEKFVFFLQSTEQYLFHGDLWRNNILIQENSISIIDIEPLFYGPKNMQFAMLISAYFLLSKILIDSNDHIDFNYIISLWPEEVNKEEILHLMLFFPIMIGLGKEQSFLQSPVDDESYNTIMNPLFIIINWIQTKLKIS